MEIVKFLWPSLLRKKCYIKEKNGHVPDDDEEKENSDEGHGFRTKEGWWVHDPLSKAVNEVAIHRAKKWGIEGRVGFGRSNAQSPCPLQHVKTAWKEHVQRERISCCGPHVLPTSPPLIKLSPRRLLVKVASTRLRLLRRSSTMCLSREGTISRREGGAVRGSGALQKWVRPLPSGPLTPLVPRN